jgi:hypothetical protein
MLRPWLTVPVMIALLLGVGIRNAWPGGEDGLDARVTRLEDASLGDRLGGHVGIATPLCTWQKHQKPTSAADRFVIAFPTGITVKIRPRFAFDLEIVPFVVDGEVDVLIHPGIIYNVSGPWSVGPRAGFTVDNDTWGFTPLVNRTIFPLAEGVNVFAELDLPIVVPETGDVAISVGTHLGIGF